LKQKKELKDTTEEKAIYIDVSRSQGAGMRSGLLEFIAKYEAAGF
jgi:hypothetical protein